MSRIDDVFCVFGDGREHGAGEIAKRVSLPESKVRKILDFLVEFGFIEFEGEKEKGRATPHGRRILSGEKSSKFPAFF